MANNDIRHLGLRVDPLAHDKLAYIAKYEGRSMSGQVVFLIQKCIREFERQEGAITRQDLDNAGL